MPVVHTDGAVEVVVERRDESTFEVTLQDRLTSPHQQHKVCVRLGVISGSAGHWSAAFPSGRRLTAYGTRKDAAIGLYQCRKSDKHQEGSAL